MKKRFDLRRLTPPGLSAKLESSWAAALLVPILLWHAVYWIALLHARNDLFLTVDGKAELIPNAVMPDFCELVRGAYNGFAILFLFLICLAFYHYTFFFRRSRSIYLMKRLPQKGELIYRCTALPALLLLASLALMGILFLSDFGLYQMATPKECMTGGQWQKLWTALWR